MRVDRKKIQDIEESFWDRNAKRSKYIDEFSERDTLGIVEKDILLKKLTLSLGDTRGKEILDCGCGKGNLSAYLVMRDACVKGFDISSEMVKLAHANAEKNGINEKCNFVCCSFGDLPYRDISFDLVVGAYILHHVAIERAVKELHRVLSGEEELFSLRPRVRILSWFG